jgi:GlpG protein
MRQAGTLSSKQDADRFSNYLLAQGIGSKVEPSDGQWAVWIRDENQVERSRQELEQYRATPDDPRYREAESAARQVRIAEAQRQRQAQKNYHDLRRVWSGSGRQTITVAMIALCVLLFLGREDIPTNDYLFFWPAILEGQVWRLITPIFFHGSAPHLLFNMLMLYQLGAVVERRLGAVAYTVLVLLIAVGSNSGQYLATGPNFVGMSGVIYGLFGYAWVRGRMDPTSGLYLRNDLVVWMLGWMVLCGIGVIGNVANWAHGAGLAAGAALGYLWQFRKFFGRHT